MPTTPDNPSPFNRWDVLAGLPPLIRDRTLSERTSIPTGTLKYWRSINTGPPYTKPGGKSVYYFRDGAAEWLAQQEWFAGTETVRRAS